MVLSPLHTDEQLALYEYTPPDGKMAGRVFIASTPQTRRICNDPLLTGLRYTSSLSTASATVLKCLCRMGVLNLKETSTTVLNILRGGLNFGLREALGVAYDWNDPPSTFISAQRARDARSPEEWHITENSYRKVHLGSSNQIVFGDVVATGTSLEYGLGELARAAHAQKVTIPEVVFLTIGGPRSHEIIERLHTNAAWRACGLKSSVVVFFEGIFSVATPTTPITIKLSGTDLLRTASILAPEFIESQYECPTYPIERCTIYDAGSRSFEISEYLKDVRHYWEEVLKMASSGFTFEELLKERFPELDPRRFGPVTLGELAGRQVEALMQRGAPAGAPSHE